MAGVDILCCLKKKKKRVEESARIDVSLYFSLLCFLRGHSSSPCNRIGLARMRKAVIETSLTIFFVRRQSTCRSCTEPQTIATKTATEMHCLPYAASLCCRQDLLWGLRRWSRLRLIRVRERCTTTSETANSYCCLLMPR